MSDAVLVLLLSFFVIAFGIFLIFGAYKKWKFLLDPPSGLWPFYTQSFIKKIAGPEDAQANAYFMGAVAIGVGLYILWFSIKGLLFLKSLFL